MNSLTRRSFLRTTAAGVAAASLAGRAVAAQDTRPNILMIVVDDLGYGDLSCYGAADLHSPSIDQLAARGMRFTQFYANCPVCSPTRASLLTGRYPDLVGVPGVIRTHRENSWGRLAEDAVLLPEVLEQQGYHSACIGKWHLGLESPNTPSDRGFDFFHGWLGDMMDDYYTHLRHDVNYMRRNREVIEPEGHATDLFTQWACDYLEERAENKAPFFCYLAYNAPHTPIQPPEDWLEKVKAREPDMGEDRAKLVALIEHMDHGIGQVLDTLEATGQEKDTLVLFVSDNGGQGNVGANNAPWRGAKQDMYEGGIRVPMIAAWPGHIEAGSESDAVGMTMDFFTTAAGVAGVEVKHEVEGVSLLPTLRGKGQSLDGRTLFWVRREGGGHGGRAYYAARRGDFKLVQNSPFEPYELYNLAADPQERKPLARNHGMYKELFQTLRQHINEAGKVPWQRES
ncbi:MAG: sulfatase-like hydrolase/transferase [Candidatus Hydrogenedentota bacterium]